MKFTCFFFLLVFGCASKKVDIKTIEEKEKEEVLKKMIESEDIFDDLPESDTGVIRERL